MDKKPKRKTKAQEDRLKSAQKSLEEMMREIEPFLTKKDSFSIVSKEQRWVDSNSILDTQLELTN